MNEQTKQEVATAIDNALTTVALREYNRLSYRLDYTEIENRIKSALNSLGGLQAGKMPDYNEWDALFYHWYQPSQINLAYSTIKSTTMVSDKLRVVDFGCGALATQFGVALGAADALEQMQPLSEVRIDSLDTSGAMVNMGQKIWEQFKVEAKKESSLRHVSLACEIMNPHITPLTDRSMTQVDNNTVWANAWQSKCWVSALHTVYEDNKDNVQRWLKFIVDKLNPDECLATTHSSYSTLLSEVWSFMDYAEYHYLPTPTIEPQFNGVLPEITQWRRKLNSTLQINHNYLNNNVTWEWPNAAFMIHAKGQTPTDADDLPW